MLVHCVPYKYGYFQADLQNNHQLSDKKKQVRFVAALLFNYKLLILLETSTDVILNGLVVVLCRS